MARALENAGGRARQAAQKLPGPGSTGNGVPQQAQAGPSRKISALQQAAQKPPSLPTGARQDRHRGGNSRSSALLPITFQAAVMIALCHILRQAQDEVSYSILMVSLSNHGGNGIGGQ